MAKRKTEPATTASPPEQAAAYTVLARRYRPQQFKDLVGQEAVAQALINAIESNRVAHAYLFTGARGVGKTSTARILAKALNCEHGPTATPCDACDICRSIAVGEDIDVIEIDGASNNSVDDVRELRQNAQYRPSRGRFRIYIIDEVHMLAASSQKSAFNALLKTLEEPPPHVKFIFATTEAQKIPATILSRCQRFEFSGIGVPQIVERLREVVSGEKREADDEALGVLARRAGGSMRDAQSLLDQLLAFTSERLSADQVHQLLGTARDDRVAALAAAVLSREPQQALELLAGLADQGLQLGELINQLIDYWRDLLVVNASGREEMALTVTGAQRAELKQQAQALKLDTILAGLDVLVGTKTRLRFSGHDRVLLEMALIRLGRLDDLVSLGQLAQWLRNPQTARTAPASPQPTAGPRAALPTTRLADEAAKKKGPPAEPAASPALLPLTNESLPRVWERTLAVVGPMLATDLGRMESVAISGPNALVIHFPSRYNLAREHCQEPGQTARIEQGLSKITGQHWTVRFETRSDNGPSSPLPPSADDGAAKAPQHDVLQEPLLKRAGEVLGAQPVPGRLDEGFGTAPAVPDESFTDEE